MRTLTQSCALTFKYAVEFIPFNLKATSLVYMRTPAQQCFHIGNLIQNTPRTKLICLEQYGARATIFAHQGQLILFDQRLSFFRSTRNNRCALRLLHSTPTKLIFLAEHGARATIAAHPSHLILVDQSLDIWITPAHAQESLRTQMISSYSN